MDIKNILIVCLLWVVACLVFYRVRKRQIVVKQPGDSFQHSDIIEYPKEFTITIVYEKDLVATDLELSDMVIKYADLVSGNYKMPTALKSAPIENPLETPIDIAPEPVFGNELSIEEDTIEFPDIELEFPQPEFEDGNQLLISESDMPDTPDEFTDEPIFETTFDKQEETKPVPVNILTIEQNFNPFA